MAKSQAQPVMIAGKRWELRSMTPAARKKLPVPKGLVLNGLCDTLSKTIYIQFKDQHPQDIEETMLHEGVHAILDEIAVMHNLPGLGSNEAFVAHFTKELLGYLNQM